MIQNRIANSCAVEPEPDTVDALLHWTPMAAVAAGESAGDGLAEGRELPLDPQAVRNRTPETSAEPAAAANDPLFR
ncbi:hypothetical protein [Streptomyces puniciscabiei]|uniref:hypothetical protein n=1 Tax=Streptomyces puniciscabiei TaxID=164348 RepID=UPI003318F961